MASKVKKGFLYYLLWFVFILVGLACIFASILLFNPGKDVFGIGLSYVSDNGKGTVNRIEILGAEKPLDQVAIEKVNINAGYSNLIIVRDSEFDFITFDINKSIIGLSNSKNLSYVFNMSLDGTTLNVNITEPELWFALSKSATVTMYFPKNSSLSSGYNFNLTTDSGNITVGSKDSYYDTYLGSLNITTKTGNIYLANTAKFLDGCATISSESSEINIYCKIQNLLKITTNDSKLFVSSIDGNLDIDSNILSAKCENIGRDVTYSSSKGYITINKVGGNFTASSDEEKTRIANVTINEVGGNVVIPAGNSSNIDIKKVNGNAIIETLSGSVNLKNCYGNVKISTQKGAVTFTQNNPIAVTEVHTENAKITANFTEVGIATLVAEKNNIEINVANEKAYKFNYDAKKSISISWITTELPLSGTEKSPVANDLTLSSINAIAKDGKITLNGGYTQSEE